MALLELEIPVEEIQQFCSRHHVRKLSLFGSAVKTAGGNSSRADSDVDLLVEFAPGQTPGFALIDMQDELSALLNHRTVDLVTPKFLNRRIGQSILQSAVVLYEE